MYRFPPVLLALATWLGFASVLAATTDPPGDSLRVESLSVDACDLAARLSPGPGIDLKLAAEIDSALSRARAMEPCLANLEMERRYSLNSILVWAWPSGGGDGTRTGDRTLDSLSAVFRLQSVRSVASDLSALTFELPLNAPKVAELYARTGRVRRATVNPIPHYEWDDRVWAYPKDGAWHLAFERRPPFRRADCPEWAFWFLEFRPEGPARMEVWRILTDASERREEQLRRAEEKRKELDEEMKKSAARALDSDPRGRD